MARVSALDNTQDPSPCFEAFLGCLVAFLEACSGTGVISIPGINYVSSEVEFRVNLPSEASSNAMNDSWTIFPIVTHHTRLWTILPVNNVRHAVNNRSKWYSTRSGPCPLLFVSSEPPRPRLHCELVYSWSTNNVASYHQPHRLLKYIFLQWTS